MISKKAFVYSLLKSATFKHCMFFISADAYTDVVVTRL